MSELDMLKSIPPEVFKAAYDDAISPALNETGKFGEDIVEMLRLVLFLPYGAAYQNRLARHLRKSIDQVPEDRRISPVESLALPIAEQLRFHDEKAALAICL
ncbi:hypothetical protein [Cupriavidus plantarum]|uniref:hypothetical protein n=1 Tax=Cupriavidus plantarum TaxID=942865 RepID=UPI001B1FA574|nr:hypothetical protein [Cupriavidus plantarum]CAG2145529.1 hypothetical protein LMG26296_03759 [Cupriavidus plantarum]